MDFYEAFSNKPLKTQKIPISGSDPVPAMFDRPAIPGFQFRLVNPPTHSIVEIKHYRSLDWTNLNLTPHDMTPDAFGKGRWMLRVTPNDPRVISEEVGLELRMEKIP